MDRLKRQLVEDKEDGEAWVRLRKEQQRQGKPPDPPPFIRAMSFPNLVCRCKEEEICWICQRPEE
jgi:hypothetical protein